MALPIPANEMYELEDPATFINAMAGAVTPVSIVTTDGPAGKFGMTVSAVSSVSADPPTVLACINQRSPACDAIRENGVFCINLLSNTQSTIANNFAGRSVNGNAPYDFSIAEWTTAKSGSAILLNATASFDCVVSQLHIAGTHLIVIGEVLGTFASENTALGYKNREYQSIVPLPANQLSEE